MNETNQPQTSDVKEAVVDGHRSQEEAKAVPQGPRLIYTYTLSTDLGPMFGFDTRPLAEIEEEWLGKWKVTSAALSQRTFEEAKASVALHKKAHATKESYETCDDEEDVKQPLACAPVKEEVFRLAGHPDLNGQGGVSVLAAHVKGISHAHPGAVAEWFAGLQDAYEIQTQMNKAAPSETSKAPKKFDPRRKKSPKAKKGARR